MKFTARNDTEEAPNAQVIASAPSHRLTAEDAPNVHPLIASAPSHRPTAEEAPNVHPLIHTHLPAAAGEPTAGSAAASFSDSPRTRC